ncbi:MAG: transporter substrate-binding domain-containing protein, partial [Desulfarculales bacterium]|nr:transporter substrate-binding domain-containing protein [Desulfarculales bacterium]
MVRFRVLVFVALVFCGSFLTAFQEAGYAAVSANDYTGFAGKNLRLAVETGDVFDKIAQEVFAPCTPVYFTTMTEAFTAVENGQADAVVLGSSYYGALKDAGVYGRFAYYELPPDRYLLSYAQVFNRASLRDEWNAWLAQKTADGSLQKRFAFWTENALPAPEQIPAYRFTGEKGVLRVCDTGNYPPFSYLIANGGHAGYDNDLVNWFASENGYTPQWTYMAYDALVPYVSSGKADMSGASFVNTEERTRQLIFGQPTAWIRVVVAAARKTEAEAARQTAISSRADGLTLDDFIGRKFAIQQGTVYETLAKGLFQDQSPLYFDDTAAMFEAVRLGKADATLYNSVTAKEFIENAGGDLVSVPVPQDIFNAPSGVISMNGELLGKYNAFLAQIKADGTLAAMNRRWFDQFDQNAPPAMPDIPLSGENGVLKVAVTADQMPFTLIVNGEVSGFEIEHMTR